MTATTVQELLLLARRQHGVVATHQGRSIASPSELRRELRTPRWIREARSVFGAAGAPATVFYRAMARLLRAGPGAIVSHDSALVLWNVVNAKLDPIHVTRMRAANGSKVGSDGIVPHETRKMPPHHVTTHLSFPIVTPSRALADVAASTPIGRVERWLDRAWTMRLVDYESLDQVLGDLDKRGRRGIRPLRTLVERRGRGYVPPESGLESRLNSILHRAELPGVRRQVDVGGRQWLGRVDFRLGDTPLLIEVQSDTYHWSLSSKADDAQREAAMADVGFQVVPIWESQVWSDRDDAIAAIEAALHQIRR